MSGSGDDVDQGFRAAMRRLAATVCVVSIWEDGRPLGMTATAVTSLTAAPPSLLVCVNKSASMHDSLADADLFCVNLLHRDQEGVARVFSDSSSRDTRFASGNWIQEAANPPHLVDAQAVLVCRKVDAVTFGTHNIYIGAVAHAHVRHDVDPLIYVDGRFTHSLP